MSNFFSELKRRNVYRAEVAYGAVAISCNQPMQSDACYIWQSSHGSALVICA